MVCVSGIEGREKGCLIVTHDLWYWCTLIQDYNMWNCPEQHTEEMGEVGRVKIHSRGLGGIPL